MKILLLNMQNEQNTKKQEILNNIEMLDRALKDKSISVNDYCTLYYTYSQQLKQLTIGA
jgi:hypothetical protein